jgi:hypothetical protein
MLARPGRVTMQHAAAAQSVAVQSQCKRRTWPRRHKERHTKEVGLQTRQQQHEHRDSVADQEDTGELYRRAVEQRHNKQHAGPPADPAAVRPGPTS